MNELVRNSLFCFLLLSQFLDQGQGQAGHDVAPPPPAGLKTQSCTGPPVPQLEDIAKKAGIHFRRVYSPEKKYIPESMSGGVVLIDYDRDGWPDIYFTNAPTIEMAMKHETARGALYHNNHDGTFTDVTDKAGIATPCFANGGAVGDYNNDGWRDLYITCRGANVLYRNNGRRHVHRCDRKGRRW